MKTKSNLLVMITAFLCSSPAANAATLRVWSGGGGDSFWATAANWTNNAAPLAGDDLLFPAGAAQLSNSNNFAAATLFNSITLSGPNYTLDGNRISLNAGLTNSNPSLGVSFFACPLTLASNQTFSSSFDSGNLLITGAIDNGGNSFSFSVGTSGDIIVDG